MRIVKANLGDNEALTSLMRQSKAHWGYSQEQMAKWKDELTVSCEYISQHQVFKMLQAQQIIGYYAFYFTDEHVVKLDSLFVLPNQIGTGLGKVLLNDCIYRVKTLGVKTINLDADPHAASFYAYHGFEVIGQLPTSIANRYLPVMSKEL